MLSQGLTSMEGLPLPPHEAAAVPHTYLAVLQHHTCSFQARKQQVTTRVWPRGSLWGHGQAVLVRLLLRLPRGCLQETRWLQIFSPRQSQPLNYLKEPPASFPWLHKRPRQITHHNLITLRAPDPLTHWPLWLASCTL